MELQAKFACQGGYRSPLLLLGFTLLTIATLSSETVAVPTNCPDKKSKLEQSGTEASNLITERNLRGLYISTATGVGRKHRQLHTDRIMSRMLSSQGEKGTPAGGKTSPGSDGAGPPGPPAVNF